MSCLPARPPSLTLPLALLLGPLGACAPPTLGTLPLDLGAGQSQVAHGSIAPSPDGTGFFPVRDDRGLSWASTVDPTLRVTLSADPTLPGLYVEHGPRSLSLLTDLGAGPVDVAVILVSPRSDGTEPLAADRTPGLHLLLAGSTEHGCPADDLELDLLPSRLPPGSPQAKGGRLALDVHISGVPYLALPPQGSLTVAAADGVHIVDAAAHVEDQGDLQLGGFRWLYSQDSDLGELSLTASTPLPWFQLQGHDGLVEVDMDHSCAAATPVLRAELDLHVTL